MTTLSQPLHAPRVAEVPGPMGSSSRLPRLLSAWMRLARAWSEALAHGLPGLNEIGAEQLSVEAAIESDYPGEWAIMGDTFIQWESGLLHTPELPSATCPRCNPQGISAEALMTAGEEG